MYQCSVPDLSTGWLKSKTQLDELARKAREAFEAAAIRYPNSPRWHILYAGPAPGGVVVGQQLNPTMIPMVQLYQFQLTYRASRLLRTIPHSPIGLCEILLAAAYDGAYGTGDNGPAEPSRWRPIPISIAVFFGKTTSCPRAMKCAYTDIPAPYAPIV